MSSLGLIIILSLIEVIPFSSDSNIIASLFHLLGLFQETAPIEHSFWNLVDDFGETNNRKFFFAMFENYHEVKERFLVIFRLEGVCEL